jgi:hypothetical protein
VQVRHSICSRPCYCSAPGATEAIAVDIPCEPPALDEGDALPGRPADGIYAELGPHEETDLCQVQKFNAFTHAVCHSVGQGLSDNTDNIFRCESCTPCGDGNSFSKISIVTSTVDGKTTTTACLHYVNTHSYRTVANVSLVPLRKEVRKTNR